MRAPAQEAPVKDVSGWDVPGRGRGATERRRTSHLPGCVSTPRRPNGQWTSPAVGTALPTTSTPSPPCSVQPWASTAQSRTFRGAGARREGFTRRAGHRWSARAPSAALPGPGPGPAPPLPSPARPGPPSSASGQNGGGGNGSVGGGPFPRGLLGGPVPPRVERPGEGRPGCAP